MTSLEPTVSGPPYRVLQIHNRYQQHGGEDVVVEAERNLLMHRGHEVRNYFRDNEEISGLSRPRLAVDTLWSAQTTRELGAVLDDFKPHIVHVHNTFPLISPAVYRQPARRNIPVVQTLHNFRLICPQAMLLRENRICEDCVGRLPWRGVVNKCYRGSYLQSAVSAAMLGLHHVAGTYRRGVTCYIATNEFCKARFVSGGLPEERILVKPHFVDHPAPAESAPRTGGLFVGRLAVEKGLSVLCRAMESLQGVTIKVVGDGPERARVAGNGAFELMGRQPSEAVLQAMREAAFLVMPSVWYETFGLVIIEAFASGLPVIASRLGSMAELIEHGKTGLLVPPGDPSALRQAIQWAVGHPEELAAMGRVARVEYERKYSPDVNYEQLMSIYRACSAPASASAANGGT